MADESAQVALDPSAPADERYDAQVEFHKSQGVGGLASALLPSSEIQPVIDHINEMWADAEMMKANPRSNLIVGPWKPPRSKQDRGGKSVFLDDFQIVAQGAYWDRPGLLGFDSMRAMVEQTPILNSIVLTRIRQVRRFCRPQLDEGGPGFAIKHIDPTVELNDEQQRSIQLLQGFMLNCGWEPNPRRRKKLKRDSFAGFMAKSVRDSLTMDANPIETEFKRDRSLGLDGFYAVDGGTIRLCTEEGYQGDDEIFALQVIQGNIRQFYTLDELVYEVRNPRSDVTACGYGYSETEMLIRIVTYLLNAMTHNGSFFDKNSIPRGILNLYGNYSPADIAAFKRYWMAMLKGPGNAHHLPVMVSKDQESKADFTEIGGQQDEMAFGKWLSFLTSIACAIYGTTPEEINMESFAVQKSSLSGADTEEKLVSSNDKGLRPLLSHFEETFSGFIIQEFSEQYQFRFLGLDDEDQKQRFEKQKLVATWNEMRGQVGLDTISGKLGDIPLNPSLIPAWQQENNVGLPEEPSEDFGDPDAADGADGGETRDGPPGDPGADGEVEDDPDGGDKPDFGKPADDKPDEMTKALADRQAFGLPVIYTVEI